MEVAGIGDLRNPLEKVIKMRPKPNSISHPGWLLAIVLILLLHTVLPAQQPTNVDQNDPELRAILSEIEADAETARLKAKIPGNNSLSSSQATMAAWH